MLVSPAGQQLGFLRHLDASSGPFVLEGSEASMKRVATSLLFAVGLALTACGSGAATKSNAGAASPRPTAYPSATPAAGPPGSPPSFVTRLDHREEDPAHGIVLTPAPSNEEPAMSGEQALEKAWHEDGWDADTATAIYAHFTRASRALSGVPVWVVRYEGACVPIEAGSLFEGSETTPGCAADTINVVINAASGEFIESFS